MILSLQAFAPAAILLLGGLWLLLRPGATTFVVVQVAALAALARLSQVAGTAVTLPVYDPLPDIPLVLRLDRLSLFFATSAVLAVVLVCLPWLGQRDRSLPYGWLALAEFGAVGGIFAGNLPDLAVGWGVAIAALLMLVLMPQPGEAGLRRPSEAVTRTLVVQLGAGALLLVAAVTVESVAGTTSYDSVPVGAVDWRTALLLVAAPLVVLGSLAGSVRACRQTAAAAVVLVGVLVPMAVYVLARTFDLAEGRPLPEAAGLVLVLGGSIGALLFGLGALWAPDLGATVARLLSGTGLILVADFGLPGPGGLVALVVAFVCLEAVAVASLGLVDAADGRLPGRGPLPGPAIAVLALLPLAALAGLAVGLGLDARLLAVRRLLDEGALGLILGVPLGLAIVALAAGSLAAARFGGGELRHPRQVAQLLVGGVTLVAVAVTAPVIVDAVVTLAAAAARAPAADVRSSAVAVLPGPVPGLVLSLVTLALLVAAGLVRGTYTSADGLAAAPDMLPPRLAVAPEIAARHALAGVARETAARASALRPYAPWLLGGAWGLAALVVVLGTR
jgi:hypothetical protein